MTAGPAASGCLVAGDAAEVARFDAFVVRGPARSDCAIWTGAIGDDGYGRFWIKRDGRQAMVRPNRYALARWIGPVPDEQVSMHLRCDNPICVRVDPDTHPAGSHVILGTQSDNLADMGAKHRSHGRRPRWARDGLTRAQRVHRSRALRDAVRHGWDAAAVTAVLSAHEIPGLFDLHPTHGAANMVDNLSDPCGTPGPHL